MHLEKQQKQKWSHGAVRDKSCGLPCLAEVSPRPKALLQVFREAVQRGTAVWSTEHRARTKSHQFFLPLCKSLAGICKGLSYKQVMAPLLYPDGG